MKAKLIKVVSDSRNLYRLEPPLVINSYGGKEITHEYVIASKAKGWTGEDLPGTFAGGMFGGNKCELLLFPSNTEGHITNWGEIGGSYQCPGGDKEALDELGYTIQKD